mmetsp:Transcript_33324/g.70971  ORF Transcript_33324/g.70971 Transcript_33324/m.70971 type:complete len:222 (+) Transcript_33324:1442-2107(+)
MESDWTDVVLSSNLASLSPFSTDPPLLFFPMDSMPQSLSLADVELTLLFSTELAPLLLFLFSFIFFFLSDFVLLPIFLLPIFFSFFSTSFFLSCSLLPLLSTDSSAQSLFSGDDDEVLAGPSFEAATPEERGNDDIGVVTFRETSISANLEHEEDEAEGSRVDWIEPVAFAFGEITISAGLGSEGTLGPSVGAASARRRGGADFVNFAPFFFGWGFFPAAE